MKTKEDWEKSPIINIKCMKCGEYYSERQGHKCKKELGEEK